MDKTLRLAATSTMANRIAEFKPLWKERSPGAFLRLPITALGMVNESDGSFDPELEAKVRASAVPSYRSNH